MKTGGYHVFTGSYLIQALFNISIINMNIGLAFNCGSLDDLLNTLIILLVLGKA